MTEMQSELIPFVGHTGLVLEVAEPRHVKLRMPFEPNTNYAGIMYAGALFPLAEEAASRGKANFGWNAELVDATGEIVAVAECLHQIRAIQG